VQESLTNVHKHAGGAAATVRLRYAPTEVVVEVANDAPPNGGGGAAAVGATPSSGFGLTGMWERAHALGGTVEAGRRPDGGFRVVAHLPTSQVVSA
jgi:signal transduction histidine kinase